MEAKTVFISAEVILAYLLRYFPVGVRVPLVEMYWFCESIKEQIFGLNKGYCFYIENDFQSLHWVVMNRPWRYEIFMDEYCLKCRINTEVINMGIPKDVEIILETTAKQWAKKLT